MYYTATEGQQYEATAAKSLSGAKRVAASRNIYQGATMHVAVKRVDNAGNECFERVAVKRHGAWQDLV